MTFLSLLKSRRLTTQVVTMYIIHTTYADEFLSAFQFSMHVQIQCICTCLLSKALFTKDGVGHNKMCKHIVVSGIFS